MCNVNTPILVVVNAFRANVSQGPVAKILNIPSNHNDLYAVATNKIVTIGTNDLFKS